MCPALKEYRPVSMGNNNKKWKRDEKQKNAF
jgi:hypothetical protein